MSPPSPATNDDRLPPDVIDVALYHKPNPPDRRPDPSPGRAPNPWMDDPPASAERMFWGYMAFLGPRASRIEIGERLREMLREGRYADAYVLALWTDAVRPVPERPPHPPLIPGEAYREPTPCTKEVQDQPPAWVKTGLPRKRGWREAG